MKKILIVAAVVGVFYLYPQFAHEFDVVNKEKNAMLRDDFKQLIMSKPPEQVILSIGKPDTTQQSGVTEYWNYHSATKDPITGKVDRNAQVVIEEGVVKKVNF